MDHAKSVTHCHLSDDIHIILFRLVLVQNTSHRDIRSRQSKGNRHAQPIFIVALATAGRINWNRSRRALLAPHRSTVMPRFIHSERNGKWQFKRIVVAS
ncbi:hypothetical protein P0D71_13545 [Paraburkholderia sp. RL17-383-BIF-A]